MLMTNKRASILDFQQEELCPDIWLQDASMRPAVKEFIIASVEGFFDEQNIVGYEDFVKDMWVGSSLASFFYKKDTDFDIKVIVDIHEFKKSNTLYKKVESDDIMDDLIKKGRQSFWLTTVVPDTYHNLDVYFYTTEDAAPINLMKYDSLYSLFKNEWYKEPKKLPKGMSPAYILNIAKQKATQYIEKLDRDVLTTRRDSIDFLILRDFLKTLEVDDLKDFMVTYKNSFDEINKDISMLLKDRDMIKKLRHDVFNKDLLNEDLERLMGSFNYSDENMVFKILQRYGYMRVLTEVHDIFERKGILPNNIPEYAKAVS